MIDLEPPPARQRRRLALVLVIIALVWAVLAATLLAG